MNRRTIKLAILGVLLTSLFGLISPRALSGDTAPAPVVASPGSKMKLSAQLIWGTDEESKDPKLKPIDPKVAKKLESLKLKWKHFYLVNVKEFSVAEGATETIEMSNECDLVIKNVDGTNVEIQLVGKKRGSAGKVTTKALGKGKCLVTGGDASNSTAWYVFMRQVE